MDVFLNLSAIGKLLLFFFFHEKGSEHSLMYNIHIVIITKNSILHLYNKHSYSVYLTILFDKFKNKL